MCERDCEPDLQENMSDPRDIDEDAILKGLSAEELDQLECDLQEMDPEVQRLWRLRVTTGQSRVFMGFFMTSLRGRGLRF